MNLLSPKFGSLVAVVFGVLAVVELLEQPVEREQRLSLGTIPKSVGANQTHLEELCRSRLRTGIAGTLLLTQTGGTAVHQFHVVLQLMLQRGLLHLLERLLECIQILR